MPSDLSSAIFHGGRILDWQENLGEGEMPPDWMWPFEDQLQSWFDRVTEERKSKYGDNSTATVEEGGSMMSNELAAGRRG